MGTTDWTVGKDRSTGEGFRGKSGWTAEVPANPRGIKRLALIEVSEGARDGEFGLIIQFDDERPDTGCMMDDIMLVDLAVSAAIMAGPEALAKLLAHFAGDPA